VAKEKVHGFFAEKYRRLSTQLPQKSENSLVSKGISLIEV
jgi:hypothetical protein